jgi:peroxiredoxin
MFWCRKRKEIAGGGAEAPGFELEKLGGGSENLSSILGRGPVLVAFYKVSCPVCQLTFPYLERLAAGTGLQVVGISQDDEKATRAFNERFGVTFQTLLDSPAKEYPASNAYGISSVPSLFVIEPDGKISKSMAGFSKRELEDIGQRVGRPPFGPNDSVPEWKAG